MHLQGSICALVTPFDLDGRLDLEALAALVDWHVDAGTSALVIAGSTGEAALLDDDEYTRLIAAASAHAAQRIPVIAGIGSPSTGKSRQLARSARAQGAAAVLAVTPYYVRPTQRGLLDHYRSIAESAELPVILYNVPGRTGCDLLPDTVAQLAAHPGIVGIKEAVADPARMAALLQLASDDFTVLSGDDPTALHAMRAGASGTISVAANVTPRRFARLCELARDGAHAEALALDLGLQALYAALGVESNPIPVKWLLERMGRLHGSLRPPLHRLSEAHHEIVGACLADIHAHEATIPGLSIG